MRPPADMLVTAQHEAHQLRRDLDRLGGREPATVAEVRRVLDVVDTLLALLGRVVGKTNYL